MADLHIFFLPFLTPGHMIPLVDLEAEERRKRARELGETARRAVEEGGSSSENITRLTPRSSSNRLNAVCFDSALFSEA